MTNKKETFFLLIIFLSFFCMFFVSSNVLSGEINILSTGNNISISSFNLFTWDDTDIQEDSKTKYSYGSAYLSQGNQKSFNNWNVIFYANVSNSSGIINQENSNCSIRFNETGVFTEWQEMSFNTTRDIWQYNQSFTYKGNLSFQINCSYDGDSLILQDNFIITNTQAYLNNLESGLMPRIYCTEDSLCIYNFSNNVSEDDYNDIIVYTSGVNTTFSSDLYELNSSQGVLTINATNDSHCGSGNFEIEIKDSGNLDSEGVKYSGFLPITIDVVNDLPIILNLSDSIEINESNSLISLEFEGYDEEGSYPLNYSIQFLNCSLASWSNRIDALTGENNCTFFSYQSSGDNLLSLLINASNDFVGVYNVSLGVYENHEDNGSSFYNITFNILNMDNSPIFSYVCDNERITSEDSNFSCWINVSDSDEASSFFFYSTPSWFTGNQTVLGVNNVSLLVNLTSSFLNDSYVGNWSINVSVATGENNLTDSRQFWFFIENENDSVFLENVSNQEIYAENWVNLGIEASDDDLYIPSSPGENSYSEELYFSINYKNGSSVDWISIVTGPVIGNLQKSNLSFYTNTSLIYNSPHELNLTVRDKNNFSIDSQLFNISVNSNNPPEFNCSFNFSCTEDEICYIDLRQNVSDSDGDTPLQFSYINYSYFPSFNLTNDGIISLVPGDLDIGFQIISINVTDGKSPVVETFYFNISNINDDPFIISPVTVTVVNLTGGFRVIQNNSFNLSEGENITIQMEIRDDDFKIRQKGYYNESHSINVSIIGPNTELLNFSRTNQVEDDLSRTFWQTIFSPVKADNGNYTLVIYATDSLNESSNLSYINFSIFETFHLPSLSGLVNYSSAIGREFYLKFNATDLEDGNSYYNNTFYFSLINLSQRNLLNSTNFNSTTGELNISLNSTSGGSYSYRVYVNDSYNMSSYYDFWIFVYDLPVITLPVENQNFSSEENSTISIASAVNHSVGDNLTYIFYFNEQGRDIKNDSGNNSLVNLTFSTRFTDESYGELRNLTLLVFPSNSQLVNSQLVNSSINLLVNITHKNSLLSQTANISNISSGSPYILYLGDYFEDYDASDSNINQSIGFKCNNLSATGDITYSVTNWSDDNTPKIIFSSTKNATEQFNITAYELDLLNSSAITTEISTMSFFVNLTFNSTSSSSSETGSGSGSSRSSSVVKYVSIKILFSNGLIRMLDDYMEIPFEVKNTGTVTLESINLTEDLFLGDLISEDINLSLSNYFIPKLEANKSENITLSLSAKSDKEGSYKILISAIVKNPKFTDNGEIRIELKRMTLSELENSLIFAEEMIKNNPPCLEITEIVKNARKFFESGDISNAGYEIAKAIESCEKLIAWGGAKRVSSNLNFIGYSFIGIILMVFLFWTVAYVYNRVRFNNYKNNLY